MSTVNGLPTGFTAGEMRDAKRNGYSQSGVVTKAYINNKVVADPYMFLNKKEPGGKVMDKVEEAVSGLNEAAAAIIKAGGAVKSTAEQTIETITVSNRKLRDNNTKIADSINVFLKTATKPEYLKAINDMERLAAALEKIAELEKAGILNKLSAVIK